MGYSTHEISKTKAQTIMHANGTEINEATKPEDLGTNLIKLMTRVSLAKSPNQFFWKYVRKCELGDNKKLYITFENDQFIVVDLS